MLLLDLKDKLYKDTGEMTEKIESDRALPHHSSTKELWIKLRTKYSEFIQTDEGKEWIESWKGRMEPGDEVDLGNYLYDFYPELLM